MKHIRPLLAVLALGACTEVAAPERGAPELSAQNRELPVFILRENGVGTEQVQELFTKLGVGARITRPDPSAPISYLDTRRFMAVPSRVVARGNSKEGEGPIVTRALDLEALKARRPLDPQTALGWALEVLRGAGMLPETVLPLVRSEPRAAHSTFEVTDRKGATLAQVDLDTHVLFDLRLELDGAPRLLGPGAKVKLVLDAAGRATQVYYGLYGLEQVATVAVLPPEDAAAACARALSRGGSAFSTERASAELVYHVPNARGRLGRARVSPSYLCEAEVPLGLRTLPARGVLIDASSGKPRLNAPLAPARQSAQTLSPQTLSRIDVGAEYVGVSQGLGGSQANTKGFTDTMSARGVPVQFSWGDYSAFERDFKDPVFGGDDRSYVDDVDMTFYTGHADGDGFTFPGKNDDGFLGFGDARWGERDLEWLVVAACGPLQEVSSGLTHSQRWGPAFRGLHQLLAYASVSQDNTAEGRILAENLLGTQILWFSLPPKTVQQAWVEAATQTQPSSVTWAVMGPFGSGYTHNYNDYFWGKGPTGGDITSPIGFWRVSGPS